MNLTDAEINAALLPLDVPGSIDAGFHDNCHECRTFKLFLPIPFRAYVDSVRKLAHESPSWADVIYQKADVAHVLDR